MYTQGNSRGKPCFANSSPTTDAYSNLPPGVDMPRRSAARQLGSRAAEMLDRPKILLLLCKGAETLRKSLASRTRLDCSNTVTGARQLWRDGRYDVVLAAFDHDPKASIELCKDIKRHSPGQLLI